MVLLLLFLLFPFAVLGAEPSVSIYLNEVQVEPVQRVEIVNEGDESVDISGWFIDDDGGTTYVTIPDGTVVQPNSCLVIEGKFNLNKSSSDTVRLFNNALPPTSDQAVPVDEYSYEASPGELISFQQIPDGSDQWVTASASTGMWNSSRESCEIVPTPTPSATIIPTPTTTPLPTITPSVTGIRVSESMVYPDSGDPEWVELYNPNSYEVTLLNWYIDDIADGGATPKKFTLMLPARSYGVYELSTGIFNNSGDSVRLLNSQDQIIDSFSYTFSQKNISIGKADIVQNTICFQEPTKGYENESCLVDEPNVKDTPTPIPTALPSPINVNSSATSHPAGYIIHAVLPKDNPYVQGIHDHTSSQNNDTGTHTYNFLSPAYSLLSIISVAVKMKLK